MCPRSGNTEEFARPQGKGRCSNRRPRQPDSASATPAASPASPPPITITLFKDILFRMAAEARLGDEHHFFGFGKPHTLAEDAKSDRLDATQQRAVRMNEQPQRAAAVRIDEAEQSRTFFIELPGALGFEAEQFANAESRFVPAEVFR